MMPKFAVLLLSGGLDSVVALYDLIHQGFSVHCVSLNYGQTHINELQCAKRHCESLGVPQTLIDLWQCKNLFQKCALTDGGSSNVVPNRNAIMLNIALALAISSKAETVIIACNLDDAENFPDCRPAFIENMNIVGRLAQGDASKVEIRAPYIKMTKRQIVERAKKIGAPYLDSISCYKGNDCGVCDACVKRKAAIA